MQLILTNNPNLHLSIPQTRYLSESFQEAGFTEGVMQNRVATSVRQEPCWGFDFALRSISPCRRKESFSFKCSEDFSLSLLPPRRLQQARGEFSLSHSAGLRLTFSSKDQVWRLSLLKGLHCWNHIASKGSHSFYAFPLNTSPNPYSSWSLPLASVIQTSLWELVFPGKWSQCIKSAVNFERCCCR